MNLFAVNVAVDTDADTIGEATLDSGVWRRDGVQVWMLALVISFTLAGMHAVEAQPSQPMREHVPSSLPLPGSMEARKSRRAHAGGAIVMPHHARTLDEEEELLRGTSLEAPVAWLSTSPVKVRLLDGTEVTRLLVLRGLPPKRVTKDHGGRAPWALVSDYQNEERAFTVELQIAPPEMLTRPLTLEALGREALALSHPTTAEQVGRMKLRQVLGKRSLSFLFVKRAAEGVEDRRPSEGADAPTSITLSYGLGKENLVLNGTAANLAKLWSAAAFPELGEEGITTKIVLERTTIAPVPASESTPAPASTPVR